MKADPKQANPLLPPSQHHFHAMVEAAPLAIVTLDLGGNVKLWNTAAEKLYGWSATEAVGKPYPVVPPGKQDEFLNKHSRVMAGETILQFEAERQRKDGTSIWTSTSVTPLKADDGSIVEAMLIVADINEAKQIQTMLMKSEERYRFLIECSIAFICIHKPDGTLQMVNSAAARALGYTIREMEGRNIREFITKEAAAKFDAYMDHLLSNGISTGNIHMLTREEELRVFTFRNVVVEEPGADPYILGNGVDITDLKITMQALEQKEEYIRLLLESSTDLVCIMEPNGKIRYFSPAVERIFGRKIQERVGQNAFENMHPEDVGRVKEAVLLSLKKPGVAPPVQYRVRHADGSWVHVESVGTNLIHDPVIHGIVVNIRDISERKRAEEERERLIGELKEAMAKVKTLTGLLPICASCKKIRDELGIWNQIELYIRDRSEAEFTHSICPECSKQHSPDPTPV